nr:MAG TPA: hypothetical protein [Caudoviricetes sp.]DAU16827.1 MAG TPA: hypothetical protein [Caudoviricetes sp.]
MGNYGYKLHSTASRGYGLKMVILLVSVFR